MVDFVVKIRTSALCLRIPCDASQVSKDDSRIEINKKELTFLNSFGFFFEL